MTGFRPRSGVTWHSFAFFGTVLLRAVRAAALWLADVQVPTKGHMGNTHRDRGAARGATFGEPYVCLRTDVNERPRYRCRHSCSRLQQK